MRAPVAPAPLHAQVREGLAFILRDRFLRSFLLYAASANAALVGHQSIAVPFLVREVGVTPSTVGLLAATGAVGGVFGAAAARPLCRRLGTARAVRIVLLAATPFGLLLPAAGPGPQVALYAVGSAVLVAGVTLCNIVLGSFRQTYTPPALLSRVVATSMFANQATIPLGAVAGGALGATLGLRTTMTGCHRGCSPERRRTGRRAWLTAFRTCSDTPPVQTAGRTSPSRSGWLPTGFRDRPAGSPCAAPAGAPAQRATERPVGPGQYVADHDLRERREPPCSDQPVYHRRPWARLRERFPQLRRRPRSDPSVGRTSRRRPLGDASALSRGNTRSEPWRPPEIT